MPDDLIEYAVDKLQKTRSSPAARCKVCGGESNPFDMVDFYKSCEKTLYPFGLSGIPVIYRKCGECEFIFTDFFDDFTSEQWVRYVYNDEYYAKLDPDYLSVRPRQTARDFIAFLAGRKRSTIGLDYGGGNGRTAALMRENGWIFDSYDPFDYTDVSQERIGHYNFCSAIEVFEHTPDPAGTLRAILAMTSADRLIIYFNTGVHDLKVSPEKRLTWKYVAPRNGHISIYSSKSLQLLAAGCGLTFSSLRAGSHTHLFTRGISESSAHSLLVRGKLLRRGLTALKMWRHGLA